MSYKSCSPRQVAKDEINQEPEHYWDRIDLDDYDFRLELHYSIFLRDLVKNVYEFHNESNEVVIYKKYPKRLKKVSRNRLIYYLQTELVIPPHRCFSRHDARGIGDRVIQCISQINKLNTIIDNMKIYLLFHESSSSEEDE